MLPHLHLFFNESISYRENHVIMGTLFCSTGVCLVCEGNTQGSNCEECKTGFYRSLGSALTEACKPCPCSNSTSTGTCYNGQTPCCTQVHIR